MVWQNRISPILKFSEQGIKEGKEVDMYPLVIWKQTDDQIFFLLHISELLENYIEYGKDKNLSWIFM